MNSKKSTTTKSNSNNEHAATPESIIQDTFIREARVNYLHCEQVMFKVSSPADVANFVRSVLTDNSREHFVALYLDGQNQVAAYSIVSIGSANYAPVGKNDLQIDDVPVSPDVQLGTGSWDALFSVEYSVRRGRTGGGVSGLARFNGSNSVGYHLGNGFSSTTEVFHRFGTDTLSFAPALGTYGEWMGLDHVQGVADHGTGGLTVFSHAGIRVWWKRMSFSAYYQHALLNQVGEFITPTQQRVVVGLTFNINKN